MSRVMVPSQAKVTSPPPASAARKSASVQFVTTPAGLAVFAIKIKLKANVVIKTEGGANLKDRPLPMAVVRGFMEHL